MKNVKKLLGIILILALVTSMGTLALAEDESHTITISNGVDGETYTAYKIFDVTIAEGATAGTGGTGFAYSITTSSEWWQTVTGKPAAEAGTEAFVYNYLKFTPTTEPGKWTVQAEESFSAATFATVLANDVSGKNAAGSIASYSSSSNTISVADLGYYFVTTSLGSLCSLDTTNTDVTIYEKNTKPGIEKEVKESSDNGYDKVADANVGGTVNYQLTINTGSKISVTAGNVDELPDGTGVDDVYTIVDTIPEGIEYTANSVVVKVGETTWTLGDDYTVAYDSTARTLTIVLGEEDVLTTKLAALGANTDIIITYNATVTGDIDIDAANTNTATLTYKSQTTTSTAKVYSWSFDVLKYTGSDAASGTKLADATFTLSKDSTVLKFIKVSDDVFRYDARVQSAVLTDGKNDNVANPDDATAKVTVVDSITTTSSGTFVIKGLDEGEYTLTETAAPDGYNTLKDPITVTIASAVSGEDEAMVLTKSLSPVTKVGEIDYVTVHNQSGAELPSTGGIGTTIFYVIGGLLIVGAGVVLVTRKKTQDD